MRVRVAAAIIAICTVVSGLFVGSTAPANAAPPGPNPVFLSEQSLFLWASPPSRYIVILGAKMGPLGNAPDVLERRLNVGADLAKGHPANRVIVTGGETWWLPVSEAQFMNLGLIKRGVPMWQMLNEARATSTLQNAEYTVGMLKGLGATGAVIVTNPEHMERAMRNFRDAAKDQEATLEFMPAYA